MKNSNLLTTTWRAMAVLALLYVFFAPSAFVSFGQTGYGTGYKQVWPDGDERIVREFALDFDWKTIHPDEPPPMDIYRASLEFELGRRFISVYGVVSSVSVKGKEDHPVHGSCFTTDGEWLIHCSISGSYQGIFEFRFNLKTAPNDDTYYLGEIFFDMTTEFALVAVGLLANTGDFNVSNAQSVLEEVVEIGTIKGTMRQIRAF